MFASVEMIEMHWLERLSSHGRVLLLMGIGIYGCLGFGGVAIGRTATQTPVQYMDGDVTYDGDEIEEMHFNFGDWCQRLKSLSVETLYQLLQSQYINRWQAFCRVEDPDDCDGYSYLVEDFGYFTVSERDPSMCRFIPAYPLREWLPDYYRNYGEVEMR